MSNAAKSMYVYAIYLLGLAATLLLGITLPMTLLGLNPPADVWSRVVGMTTLFLAYYFVQAGRHELTLFMRWTVVPRLLVPVFFAVFVLLGFAPPAFILLGLPDIPFALWTWYGLRSTEMVTQPASA